MSAASPTRPPGAERNPRRRHGEHPRTDQEQAGHDGHEQAKERHPVAAGQNESETVNDGRQSDDVTVGVEASESAGRQDEAGSPRPQQSRSDIIEAVREVGRLREEGERHDVTEHEEANRCDRRGRKDRGDQSATHAGGTTSRRQRTADRERYGPRNQFGAERCSETRREEPDRAW